jgi:hypothetical protein
VPYLLPLPHGFPRVTISHTDVHTTLAPSCGLPGVEVRVLLGNGYGLNLLKGRGYSTGNTVEAMIIRHHGDPADWEQAEDTPVRTNAGPGLQGWADGAWLTAALATLTALPPHSRSTSTTGRCDKHPQTCDTRPVTDPGCDYHA